jgi:hypothetical protein
MASYKSQFPPPRRIEEPTPSTRLPKRSVTPTAITSQLPTSTQSRLQKRKPSRDEPVQSERKSSNYKESVQKLSSRQTTSTAARATVQAPSYTSYKARSTSSSSRLPKLDVAVNTRTPSLVSGSSASTIESPRSNVLRRKQPSVGATSNRHALRTRDDSMSSQEDAQAAERIPVDYKDPFAESVFYPHSPVRSLSNALNTICGFSGRFQYLISSNVRDLVLTGNCSVETYKSSKTGQSIGKQTASTSPSSFGGDKRSEHSWTVYRSRIIDIVFVNLHSRS